MRNPAPQLIKVLFFFFSISIYTPAFSQINSSGLLFDGFDDYATIPQNNAYNLGTGDFTIETWVRMYFYQKNIIQYAYLLTNNTGAGGISIFLGITHNFVVTIGPDSYNFTHNLNDNLCHHIALVRSGTSVMFYVDGNLMQTVTKPAVSNVGITANAIRLGTDIMFGNSFYTGFIHELRFWNIARSQANIQSTMNIGLTGSESGLIGYWKCNDLSGQVINDYSPTNNDGQRGSGPVSDLQDPEFIPGCSNCSLPSSGTITAGGPTSFCQGGSVVLTAPPGYTYYWIGQVPYPSNNRNQTFTATGPGNYACIIGNNCGNIISNFIQVSIITGTAIVTALGPTTYCAPGSVTLNANTGTGLTYQWGNDNVAIPGATTSSYTVTNQSGHYYCTVTTGGCSTTSNVITISVVTSVPQASISANGLTTFCPGGNVSMIANSGTGFTYQWRQNATPIPGATSQLYSTGGAGSYDCLVTNICGTATSNSVAVNYSTTCSGGLLFSSSNNNRVTINNNAAYNFGTGDFTIETWVKAAVGQTNSFPTIISNRQTTISGFRIFLSNGRFRIQLGSVSTFEVGPLLTDNNCHHLALTRSGTTVYMYVDGILEFTQTGMNQDVSTTHAMWIGADEPAAPLNFNGVINDVRLWNISKTQAQIQASRNIYLTGAEAGLAGYWKMNDGSGQTVQDFSAALNNGVLGSTSAVESIDPAFTTTGCIPACTTTASISNGGPTTFCSPGSVTLNANTGTGLSYQWRLNGVNISGGTTSSYVAAASGNYNCIVTSTCGNATSNSITVTVNSAPPATISAGGPTTFCSPGSVTLNANTGTGLSYQWRSNGVDISAATNSSYVVSASENYDCVVSNVCGNVASNSIHVVAAILPTAIIIAGGPVTFCAPGSVTLSEITGIGVTYQWRLNSVNISGATAFSYVASAGGNYDCIVSNICGNVPSNSIAVTVNNPPAAIITAGGPTTFCSPGSVTLSANTGTGLTYQWRRNGGNISGATSSSYVVSIGAIYDCVVSNVCGSTSSNSFFVIVNLAPIATITAGGPVTFCSPGSVTLSANTGTGLTYQWRLSSVNISGATASSYVVSASGNYNCIISNTCGSVSSNSIVITVNSLPTASITAGGAVTFCAPSTVTLNANTGTGVTYQWKQNGSNISGATTSSYIANASGNYTCLVSNSCGGVTSNSIAVTVNAIPATPGSITGPATGVCSSVKTYSISAVAGATGYTWSPPAGATVTSGQGTISAGITFTGTFSGGLISVSASNGCGSSLLSSLTVTGAPAQPGTITGLVSVCHNQNNVSYSIVAVASATSYTWTVPAGAQIKTGQGTRTIKVRFGNSAGNITVKANNGCGSSPLRTLAIAMPCRESEDGLLENNFDITVYPNPTGMQFTFRIDAPGIDKYNLRIFDLTGRMVESFENLSVKEKFSCGDKLKSGIYIGEIMLGDTRRLLRLIKSE
jgi:hypothetical protein